MSKSSSSDKKGQTMPDPTVIDLDIVLQRLNGNRAMLAVLANFFLEDAPQVLEQLHDGLRSNSLSDVQGYAHSLRGLASTFEPNPVVELAAEIETHGRNRDASQLPALTAQLDSEFARLVDALQVLTAE